MTGEVQFGRYCKLILGSGSDYIDLSEFRIKFSIRQGDTESPSNAAIRVYNLNDAQIKTITERYKVVTLDAGYETLHGVIFTGQVKQYRHGKENYTDRFLDIYAADGDSIFVTATISAQLPSNASIPQFEQTLAAAAQTSVTDNGATNKNRAAFGGILPRGRVLFGMLRSQIQAYSRTQDCRWRVDQNKITFIPNAGFDVSKQIVELNAASGLIGFPEATEQGLEFKALLNPNIQCGGIVRLDNTKIVTTDQLSQGYPNYNSVVFPALLDNNGDYRVLVVDYEGDTRGQEWYAECIGLALSTTKGMNFTASYGTES
jgi:hypothetical protein